MVINNRKINIRISFTKWKYFHRGDWYMWFYVYVPHVIGKGFVLRVVGTCFVVNYK